MTHSVPHASERTTAVDPRFLLPEINSWRLYNKAVTQESILQMAESWEAHGYRFGCVCVDDGWQENGWMGAWEPDPRRFPDPGALGDAMHGRGYALRVWVAPAQVHPGTPIFDELWPHGFLKNSKGEPSFYVGLGCYTLDIRNERARRHVFESMQRVARQWKADAFKVDFPPFSMPDDDFYKLRDYDLPERDKQSMGREFYRTVREALDAVRPGLRVEGYPNTLGAADYLDDMLGGDLIGSGRDWPTLLEHARGMFRAAGERPIVPWLDMIWGEGADHANDSLEWHAGFIEFMAASINLGLKLEHSFQPFDYPNANQIRVLSNLYGPRNPQVKVLAAGRRVFRVEELLAGGVRLDARTRFLAAPAADTVLHLPTAPLKTNAIDWRGRNVLTGEPLRLRSRNEFWGGTTTYCRVEFDARANEVYELWYEGQETDYFTTMLPQHLHRSNTSPQPTTTARPAE